MKRIGTIKSLWRYPVKSMAGNEMTIVTITENHGVEGDRQFALIDESDGRVGSAKNPRKWLDLLNFQATLNEDDSEVTIQFPNGKTVSSSESQCNEILSTYFQRTIKLESNVPELAQVSNYIPDKDTIETFQTHPGTFFDGAPIHIVTTASIKQLEQCYSEGDFSIQRFRPNIVIETDPSLIGFIENEWMGKVLVFQDGVRLKLIDHTPRCVMTTVAQSSLPADSEILKTIYRENKACVGVYAEVITAGIVRQATEIHIES